jgi:hypothetical protein
LSDSAARHRARQTVINLCLALAASIGLVVTLVLIVPRDDSNRIKEVNYPTISQKAKVDSGFEVITITPPTNWWSNNASLTTNNIDTVPVFKAGFVGSDIKYIGYTQAFNANPTWLALSLNGKVITGEYSSQHYKWDIYESVVKNDPKKTMDYIMVLNHKDQDYVLLYGVADQSEFKTFVDSIDKEIWSVPQLD